MCYTGVKMEHLRGIQWGGDDAHTLYEYGSMPRVLAESERWAHLWGHYGASYAAEDDLA